MSQTNVVVTRAVDALGRRSFLTKTSFLTLGVAAATGLIGGCASAGAGQSVVSKTTEEDIGILNTALALEYQAIAAYQIGAESGLLQKPVLDVAVKFQSHHRAHAGVLSSTISKMRGTAVEPKEPAKYGFPVNSLKNQTDVLRFAAGLEKGAASAYLGAVPVFHNRDLAKAAASILGDETMHWAILLNALGEDPVPVAFIS